MTIVIGRIGRPTINNHRLIWSLACVLLAALLVVMIPLLAMAQEEAIIYTDPAILELPPGQTGTLRVIMRGVANVYNVAVFVGFDQTMIEILDADTGKDGVQVSPGPSFLSGLQLSNLVDNEQGTLEYVVTQINPSPPASADVVLFSMLVRARGSEGESYFVFMNVQAADRNGADLPLETQDGIIMLAAPPAQSPSPTQQPSPTLLPPTPTRLLPSPTPTRASPTVQPTPATSAVATPSPPMASATPTRLLSPSPLPLTATPFPVATQPVSVLPTVVLPQRTPVIASATASSTPPVKATPPAAQTVMPPLEALREQPGSLTIGGPGVRKDEAGAVDVPGGTVSVLSAPLASPTGTGDRGPMALAAAPPIEDSTTSDILGLLVGALMIGSGTFLLGLAMIYHMRPELFARWRT